MQHLNENVFSIRGGVLGLAHRKVVAKIVKATPVVCGIMRGGLMCCGCGGLMCCAVTRVARTCRQRLPESQELHEASAVLRARQLVLQVELPEALPCLG